MSLHPLRTYPVCVKYSNTVMRPKPPPPPWPPLSPPPPHNQHPKKRPSSARRASTAPYSASTTTTRRRRPPTSGPKILVTPRSSFIFCLLRFLSFDFLFTFFVSFAPYSQSPPPTPMTVHHDNDNDEMFTSEEQLATKSSYEASKCNLSTPDYSHLEYPPVFEPETYTLTHPGPSILKNKGLDADRK